MNFDRQDNESLASYIWRIGQEKEAGLIDATWRDIADIANPQFFDDETEYLGESAFRKRYSTAKEFYENVFKPKPDLWQKNKERIKLQTEKLEYNKWLRENARDELIFEKVAEGISQLPPLAIPAPVYYEPGEQEYVLVFGDTHYGIEFELQGFNGEILNEYSPEIFEKRMWDLRDRVMSIMDLNEVGKLNIIFTGDGIDGILRTSQLMKLRYGVVDSTLLFAEFMSNWLNDLSGHYQIKFNYTYGNHGELRMLGQPKGTFTEDNMEKVVAAFLKARLENNPNIEIIDNPTGYVFQNYCGSNVVCIHGETKNMVKTLGDLSRIYGTKIDYLMAGHLHHGASKDVGIDSEVINVLSVIGTDPYALSLGCHTNAGAKLFVFEEGCGIVSTFNCKL